MSMISLPAPLLSDSPAIERFANVWGYAWLDFVDFLIEYYSRTVIGTMKTVNHKKHALDKKCAICSGSATGAHYGVITIV